MRTQVKNVLVAVFCSAALLSGCGGGDKGSPAPNPPGPDVTPNSFSFTDQTNVAPGSEVTSAAITISGIDAATTVSVVGGTYSVNGGAFTAAAGTLSNGNTVQVRHTSAATPSTATDTTLTVGGVSDTFTSITTATPGADITPDAFNFADQTNVATSAEITSAAVTITGIDSAAPVSVTDGTYSVNGGAFTAAPGTVSNGDSVQVRHTSAATAGTPTNTTLTVSGVSDTFTSTTDTGVPIVGLLPFLTGGGDLRLLSPGSTAATADSGLAPPPTGMNCNDCFDDAEVFFTGRVSGTTVSNVHASRMAYVKNGAVFKLDITQGGSNVSAQISSIADACRIVSTETTDFASIDNSAVVVERPGVDGFCYDRDWQDALNDTADNVVTVIRLNSAATDAGISIPLAVNTGNPLHARTNASGAVIGYVSFEGSGANSRLVSRDASLNEVGTLMALNALEDTVGSNIESVNLTTLFVTATRLDNNLELYRIEGDGSMSPMLHSFEFNAGNPIQSGLHDAVNLYFSDNDKLLRIALGSTSADAAVITTLACTPRTPTPEDESTETCLRIGNRTLDAGVLVFEALDNGSTTLNSGVFSVAATASNAAATTLASTPDLGGGSATIAAVANGRAYINITNHDALPDALKINTDGSAATTTPSAYWAGSSRAESFNLAVDSDLPTQYIFLATRVEVDGVGSDTLSVVDPATGVAGAVLGTVGNTASFQAVKVNGLGRYALARAERVRDDGSTDNDVFSLDALTAGSLAPLAETSAANDIPLAN